MSWFYLKVMVFIAFPITLLIMFLLVLSSESILFPHGPTFFGVFYHLHSKSDWFDFSFKMLSFSHILLLSYSCNSLKALAIERWVGRTQSHRWFCLFNRKSASCKALRTLPVMVQTGHFTVFHCIILYTTIYTYIWIWSHEAFIDNYIWTNTFVTIFVIYCKVTRKC